MKKALIPVGIVLLIMFLVLLFRKNDFKVSWNQIEYQDTTQKPVLKIYIESSGSMDGYLCSGSELKDAVYSYVSTLDSYSDTLELNYINSQIIPYDGSLQTFVRELNVAAFKRIGGNKANSDLGNMFEQILKAHNPLDVSIFVSDCILDVPQGDAKDYLVNRQIDIHKAFVKKLDALPNLGVEIFRLESAFDGYYYSFKGSKRLSGVKRPYYMWVIGDKHLLAYLNTRVPFTEIKHGYKDYFAYSTYEEVPFSVTNQFGVSQNPLVLKTSINNHYVVKIQANLSTMLQNEAMACNADCYHTQSPKINIVKVERNQNLKDHNTHVLTLSIDGNIASCSESIRFVLPAIPRWLDSANDESGDYIDKNLDKTTGIKNIISGVSDAYRDHLELAGMRFVINN
ncbi:MAG: hypothetical protein IKH32_00465 [Prevotella sp.]|nr:hypothetical protein [Prevotella sp.]